MIILISKLLLKVSEKNGKQLFLPLKICDQYIVKDKVLCTQNF